MSRSGLREFAQLAEIIAAVAVVISLLYVVRGLDENTAAIRASSAQSITAGTREALLAIALDEQLSRIVQTGISDMSKLSAEEAFRFALFSRQRWLFLQGVWIQRNLGVLDDKVWTAYERVICSILDEDLGSGAEWSNHVGILDPEFVAFVEGCGDQPG